MFSQTMNSVNKYSLIEECKHASSQAVLPAVEMLQWSAPSTLKKAALSLEAPIPSSFSRVPIWNEQLMLLGQAEWQILDKFALVLRDSSSQLPCTTSSEIDSCKKSKARQSLATRVTHKQMLVPWLPQTRRIFLFNKCKGSRVKGRLA